MSHHTSQVRTTQLPPTYVPHPSSGQAYLPVAAFQILSRESSEVTFTLSELSVMLDSQVFVAIYNVRLLFPLYSPWALARELLTLIAQGSLARSLIGSSLNITLTPRRASRISSAASCS